MTMEDEVERRLQQRRRRACRGAGRPDVGVWSVGVETSTDSGQTDASDEDASSSTTSLKVDASAVAPRHGPASGHAAPGAPRPPVFLSPVSCSLSATD